MLRGLVLMSNIIACWSHGIRKCIPSSFIVCFTPLIRSNMTPLCPPSTIIIIGCTDEDTASKQCNSCTDWNGEGCEFVNNFGHFIVFVFIQQLLISPGFWDNQRHNLLTRPNGKQSVAREQHL